MNKKGKSKVDSDVYEYRIHLPANGEHINRVLQEQNKWVGNKLKEYNEKYKGKMPELRKSIKKKTDKIFLLIEQYDPLELLSTVSAGLFIDPEKYKESTYGAREISVEYAQSLVLSKKRKPGGQHATEEAIEQFNSLTEEIVWDVAFYFAVYLTEKIKDIDELRLEAIASYLFLRGNSYPEHHVEMIRDIFKDHDDFLTEYYGFDSEQLIQCAQNIDEQVISNVQLMSEWISFCYERDKVVEEFFAKEDLDDISSEEEFEEKFLSLPEAQRLLKKKDKFDYKIRENPCEIVPTEEAPLELLKLLSSHFGDNSAFATFGKFPAWATNDSVIYEHPLIEDNGRFYCFSPVLLFRNIGDILERWIQKKDDDYYQNIYQKKRAEYLEHKALEYLGNILPEAKIFGNLFYNMEEEGKKTRYQTDGLILYDENLFIIEAKAGKFSKEARRGSPKRIKRDLGRLINEAYEQALRTKGYIMKTAEPKFESQDGSEVLVIKDKDIYRNIYLFNITLENLWRFSTQLSYIKRLNLIQGKEWPWSVFINDLRLISELIEFPSEFLHYLERRIRMNDYPQFHTLDELAFLMYYFRTGFYFEDGTLQNIQECVPLGFTEELDRYYDYIAGRVSSGKKPQLMIPEKFKNVIIEIESTGKHGFTKITKALLDYKLDSVLRYDIICGIDQISSLVENPQIRYFLEALSAYGKARLKKIPFQEFENKRSKIQDEYLSEIMDCMIISDTHVR